MTDLLTQLARDSGLLAKQYNGFDRTDLKPSELAFAHAIIDHCIEVIKPSSYAEAHPDNYKCGQDGIDLLNYKVAQLKLLK
jgi:hypothetical protein